MSEVRVPGLDWRLEELGLGELVLGVREEKELTSYRVLLEEFKELERWRMVVWEEPEEWLEDEERRGLLQVGFKRASS